MIAAALSTYHNMASRAQRLKEDEQKLTELRRVEAERGGSSDAVKLIFPP